MLKRVALHSFTLRLFLLLGLMFPATAFATIGWATKASMAGERDNLAVVTLNGVIYALGGAPSGITVLDSMEAYNPATNKWTTKVSMQTRRYGLSAATVNGVIYAIGGTSAVDGSGPINSMEVYAPTSNSWSYNIPGTTTPLTPMPTARWGFDTSVVNGVIYAIGGAIRDASVDPNVDTYYGTVEAYDPETNIWTTKAPMPTPRYGMTVAVVNGLIYAIGGWGGWPELAVVEVYDPATDTWSTTVPGTATPLATMPTARDDFAYAVVNGVIYAIGGDINAIDYTSIPPTPCCTTVVESYDPVANTWTTQTAMPTMRDDFDAAVVDGVIYAIGGSLDGDASVGGGVSYTTVEALTTSDIPTPRNVSASVGTGQVSLSWSAVAGATAYNIYWSTKPGISTASGTKITGATSPYVHTGRSAGTWYYYVVTAITAAGESLPSNEVSAHAYRFTAQIGVPLSSEITSNPIRVVGITSSRSISITGGTYSINGGAFTSAAGTVALGNTVTVRLTSSASAGTTSTASLSIGGVIVAFHVTTIISVNKVVSRKTHGATSFALTIDHTQALADAITVEPRSIGAGHTLVFHFDAAVTSIGTVTALDALMNPAGSATAAVVNGDVEVTLTHVADGTRLTITLNGINGDFSAAGIASASMGFLVGDVTNSHAVNAADISAVSANVGKTVDNAALALFDLNVDGVITAADVAMVKVRSGLVLAP